jgi:hypothetical protein
MAGKFGGIDAEQADPDGAAAQGIAIDRPAVGDNHRGE